jgi:hypothetical protein
MENDVPFIELTVVGINEGILGHRADRILTNILASILLAHASILVNIVKNMAHCR